jgi:arabinan endo-1,5-alpha-L-arabinosidase
MKKRLLLILLLVCVAFGLAAEGGAYSNPVVARSLPDPTIIRSDDGDFYLYATEDIRNTPIYRSSDLVNWTFQGTAFTNSTRPNFEPNGGIWAPDVNYIDRQYVMYYSMSVWGGEQTCGIGVATSRNPQGPFTDRGKLFRSNEIGVQNSIDPFYIEDNGKKYLFWGSFHGIYYVELSESGLSLKNPENPQPQQVAGTAFEGTYIYKRGDYYYLFASIGSCCDGLNSTYRLVVGRSTSLTGPYLDVEGKDMLQNNYLSVIASNSRFVGNGHCSEIVQDDNGNDWILFHGWDANNANSGRVLLLNRIQWSRGGWPSVTNGSPAISAEKPVFGTSGLDETDNTPFQLQTNGNRLVFKSSLPADLKIYTPDGRLVGQYRNRMQYQTSLLRGIYLIQVNTAALSVVKTIVI